MLGLGDIVIPGIFVAIVLRHDAARAFAGPRYFYRCAWVGRESVCVCVWCVCVCVCGGVCVWVGVGGVICLSGK
jgi:hypothetical protein